MSWNTHGHTKHRRLSPEYHSWNNMLQRCCNPKDPDYHHYGGRGISVAPEWRDFAVFFRDMGPKPPRWSLDRIDVNGDYTPDNCRWAPQSVQCRNMRTTIWVVVDGRRVTLREWCELRGVPVSTVRMRVQRRKMSYEEVIARWDDVNFWKRKKS